MADIPTQYQCPVCQEVFKKPVAINKCGHKFCYQCLLRVPRTDDGSAVCPVCRLSFRLERDIAADRILEREITFAVTMCGYCYTQFALTEIDSHSQSCSQRKQVLQFRPIAPTNQVIKPTPNRSTFNCPLCSHGNLDCKALVEHVNLYHSNSTASVVCPVCASMPWGSSHQHSQNFIQHVNRRHRFEYDTFVDYDQDDDAALRAAIQASLMDS